MGECDLMISEELKIFCETFSIMMAIANEPRGLEPIKIVLIYHQVHRTEVFYYQESSSLLTRADLGVERNIVEDNNKRSLREFLLRLLFQMTDHRYLVFFVEFFDGICTSVFVLKILESYFS